jgi:hypothetical protein
MSKTGFLAQLLARDPRKIVRFPDYPIDAALAELAQLQQQITEAQAKLESGPAAEVRESGRAGSTAPVALESKPNPAAEETIAPALAALATNVWRAKGKLVDPNTGEAREEFRKVYRHVEASYEAFAQMGLTINDWLNQPYDPGLPVKVLTFLPTPGVTRDMVVEAVRPTVIWKDQLLQLAEVVVGIPPNTDTNSESNHN